MDTNSDKKFVDACVQTSPIVRATFNQSILDFDIPLATLKEDFQVSASAGVGESLLQNATLSSGDTGVLDLVTRFPRTPSKAVKSSLPSARPSQFTGLVVDSNLQRRIVSLPENLGIDTLKEDIARSILSGPRSVSMPAAYRHFATLDTSIEERKLARNTPSFSTDCEEDSRIQVFLRSPGLPETPSPPSSPDSIEIIENSAHLPESFLHNKRKPTKEASVHRKGRGSILYDISKKVCYSHFIQKLSGLLGRALRRGQYLLFTDPLPYRMLVARRKFLIYTCPTSYLKLH